MAEMKLNVGAGLAREITEYVGALGRAAGVSTGHGGTSAGYGFVGTISAGRTQGGEAAGQRILDEVQRKFGERIRQQSGMGQQGLDSWAESERIRRFG